ncbi:MAG: hypothetical protein WC380_03920 [Pedobacter sp.]|jgi:hypothetical protein
MELSKKYYFPWHIPFRKELAGIIVVMVIFLLFPYLIRKVDGSAAAIDPGILSALLLTATAVLLFKAMTWWILITILPAFADYSDRQLESNFRMLGARQKVIIYLSFYMLVFYAFILVLSALL